MELVVSIILSTDASIIASTFITDVKTIAPLEHIYWLEFRGDHPHIISSFTNINNSLLTISQPKGFPININCIFSLAAGQSLSAAVTDKCISAAQALKITTGLNIREEEFTFARLGNQKQSKSCGGADIKASVPSPLTSQHAKLR